MVRQNRRLEEDVEAISRSSIIYYIRTYYICRIGRRGRKDEKRSSVTSPENMSSSQLSFKKVSQNNASLRHWLGEEKRGRTLVRCARITQFQKICEDLVKNGDDRAHG